MHRVDHPKAKTERDSKSLKRRINSVTEEDSHKDISGFVQRNPADHEEGLVTHSTLTQGKAAPGRDRRGHGERAPYRVTADPGRAKDHPRPPAHQEMSHRDWGRDLGTYTRGAARQLIFTNRGTSYSLEGLMWKLKVQYFGHLM